MRAQHHDTAKPQHDDNHNSAEEFAHRMGCLLAYVHPHYVVTIESAHAVETMIHLLLSAECLDDTQSAEGFLHLAHRVAPQSLRLD